MKVFAWFKHKQKTWQSRSVAKKGLRAKAAPVKEYSWYHSTWFWVGSALLVGLFAYGTLLQITYGQQLRSEVGDLSEELAWLEADSQNLVQEIEYRQTEEYRRLQYKEKLAAKEPGERVFIVRTVEPEVEQVGELEEVLGEQFEETVTDRNNVQKWWEYFFGT